MSMIQVANAPCSWGTLEFEGLEGETIGYRQMLDELVETGYTGTELGDWGFMPTDPDALRAELTARGLTMLAAFVPVNLRDPAAHAEGRDRAVRTARLLEAVAHLSDPEFEPLIVLADDNGRDPVRTRHAGRITPEMALVGDAWPVFADGAMQVARAVLHETGLGTVFHHHCAGFVETPDEIARLFGLVDPDVLGLVFDTGHLAYGGGCEAVLEGLDRFEEHIRYVHFKDCDPGVARRAREEGWDYFEAVRNGIFCELGQGCVDFPAVLERLREQYYEGWVVVEQDVLPGMGAPRESARRNRAYLRSIGL